MHNKTDHKVSFGQIVRTIVYEDSIGTVLFTFDVDTSGGKNTIILERSGKVLLAEEQMRDGIALGRIKEYLMAIGYQVEVFPPD